MCFDLTHAPVAAAAAHAAATGIHVLLTTSIAQTNPCNTFAGIRTHSGIDEQWDCQNTPLRDNICLVPGTTAWSEI